MSGVIDENGVQWEHCNECGGWVKLNDLGFQEPTIQYPGGRDLCVKCVDSGIRAGKIDFNNIIPAKTWIITEISTDTTSERRTS